MEIIEANRILDGIKFLHFKFIFYPVHDQAELRVEFKAPDTRNRKETLTVTWVAPIILDRVSESELVRFVFTQVTKILKHEASELYTYLGKALYDEHLEYHQKLKIAESLFMN